ncbi:MAG: hypothetical protein A2096_10040 [Spirochaetes bacterium GWF1_41_5]|nr:MAG: hypothetical protein A2096_10040 [Spirochaetes bacterium GWF1_41_5]HBE00983.1 hypothetical protein [Spirochaetia bacterium]
MNIETSFISSRSEYNSYVRFFNKTMAASKSFSGRKKAAAVLKNLRDADGSSDGEIQTVIQAVLLDKLGYKCKSVNLPEDITVSPADGRFNSLEASDLFFTCYTSEGDMHILDPHDHNDFTPLLPLKKRTLLVIFIQTDSRHEKMMNEAYSLLYKKAAGSAGKKNQAAKKKQPEIIALPAPLPPALQPVRAAEETAAPGPAAVPANIKSSEMASVQVTNELFHNGNVEAWKRIIASYENKYPGRKVNVFYDGEKIENIMSLFQWGKVKIGTCIMFTISGPDYPDIIKLKKYLHRGASPFFESFISGNPDEDPGLFK